MNGIFRALQIPEISFAKGAGAERMILREGFLPENISGSIRVRSGVDRPFAGRMNADTHLKKRDHGRGVWVNPEMLNHPKISVNVSNSKHNSKHSYIFFDKKAFFTTDQHKYGHSALDCFSMACDRKNIFPFPGN